MDLASLPQLACAFALNIFEGQTGFLARYTVACSGFIALAMLLRRAPAPARSWGLILGSLAILSALAGALIAAIFALYTVVFYAAVESLPKGHPRTAVLVFLVAVHAIGPIFWLPHLSGYVGDSREFVAFSTNLTMLRFWGYAYDRSRRPEPDQPRFADYALYMLFFPAFTNGPIVTHTEFKERQLDWYWKDEERPGLLTILSSERVAIRRALLGVALGLFVMAVIIPYRMEVHKLSVAGGITTWPAAFYNYAWWYLAFTAWTEAAIGISRLAGIHLPENFDAPHFSYGPADFWRRWNITFMVWLRRFIYLPLGGAFVRGRDGKRHLEWRNTAAVFFAVAGYHLLGGLKLLGPAWFPWTAYVPWTIWAAMNTVAVIATRGIKRPERLGVIGVVVMVSTLMFAAIGHMTATYPPHVPLDGLFALYRGLVWP